MELLPSFRRHLSAENKAPRTAQAYTEGVTRLHEFLMAAGMPLEVGKITREHVEAFIADQVARLRPASARSRYASVRAFFKWAVEEGKIPQSPMARIRRPHVPEQPVPVLNEAELRLLLKGPSRDSSFYGRRDEAILRVLIDTGARLAELSGLRVEDVDLDSGVLRFLGKGRRERWNPIGWRTVRALDRCLRLRSQRADGDSPGLWLGRSGPMTGYGVTEVVKRRAEQAGIGWLHPHQLRHSAAHHLSPEERTLRARVAAHSMHAAHDGREVTAKARARFNQRFLDEGDPNRGWVAFPPRTS